MYGILNTRNKIYISKSKNVVTRECLKKSSKYICLQNLGSKLYLPKIFLKNYFWTHLPSTMFWLCILSPRKIFSFQTIFLFKLEDDCNKNWIFCLLRQFWPLKIKISPNFFIFSHRIVWSWSLKNGFRPKCWYLPLKFVLGAVCYNENQSQFKPLKINIAQIFLIIMGRIKCSFKKQS